MIKSVIAMFSVFLFCVPDFLFSDENTPIGQKRELLAFSNLLTSEGSTGCPSSQSIKLINTGSALRESFKELYECSAQSYSRVEPPNIDLTNGVAVLLDMGIQGSLGHYITAIRVTKYDGNFYLTFATLEPGEGCWAAAQMQRPFQLIYIEEKIDFLNTRHVRGFESCADQ